MKTNKKYWHSLIILLMGMLYTGGLRAQVTIGDETPPKKFSLLEISTENEKGGLRLPQLETADITMLSESADAISFKTSLKKGLVIYNNSTDCIDYWNGTQWVSLSDVSKPEWFYMPSIAIDVFNDGTFFCDLYAEYKKQFDTTAANSKVFGSDGAPAGKITRETYAASDFYYYVTEYDDTVFTIVNITANGVLEYEVNSANVSDATYMNIVFVVK